MTESWHQFLCQRLVNQAWESKNRRLPLSAHVSRLDSVTMGLINGSQKVSYEFHDSINNGVLPDVDSTRRNRVTWNFNYTSTLLLYSNIRNFV